MANCINCGAALADGTNFCPNCGANQMAGVQNQYQPAPTPVPHKKRNDFLIAVVIIVVAVVAIASVSAVIIMNSLNQVHTNHVNLNVDGVTDPYNDTILTPSAGKHFVMVDVTMSAETTAVFPMTVYFFTLEYELNGTVHDQAASGFDQSSLPSSIPAGGSASFSVGFEVPDGALPKSIQFEGVLASGKATIT